MNIQTANTLFNQGIFTELYKAGFITAKVFTYREIYLWVHAQVQTRGIGKNQAVLEAEVKFNRDERTIWRILNTFTTTDTLAPPLH
jgi:GNAT superfamily N-acetyltransferase